MTDTVFTQDMIDALKKAYASGTLSLEYEGKRIQYRSLAEMQTAMNRMQREVDEAAGIKSPRQVRVKTSRGLNGRVC